MKKVDLSEPFIITVTVIQRMHQNGNPNENVICRFKKAKGWYLRRILWYSDQDLPSKAWRYRPDRWTAWKTGKNISLKRFVSSHRWIRFLFIPAHPAFLSEPDVFFFRCFVDLALLLAASGFVRAIVYNRDSEIFPVITSSSVFLRAGNKYKTNRVRAVRHVPSGERHLFLLKTRCSQVSIERSDKSHWRRSGRETDGFPNTSQLLY